MLFSCVIPGMMLRQAIRPAGGGGKHLFANFPGQKPDFKRLYIRIARTAPFPSLSREMPRNASTPWNAGQFFYRNLRTKSRSKTSIRMGPSHVYTFFQKRQDKNPVWNVYIYIKGLLANDPKLPRSMPILSTTPGWANPKARCRLGLEK